MTQTEHDSTKIGDIWESDDSKIEFIKFTFNKVHLKDLQTGEVFICKKQELQNQKDLYKLIRKVVKNDK